jgi:hypothetical protein
MAAACAAATASAQTLDFPRGEIVPYVVDSGFRTNLAVDAAVVYEAIVHVKDAAWMRLHFAPGTQLGRGSFLRVRSLEDGEVQELDLRALASWNRATAYFNGSAVSVELVAGPATTRNRLRIEQAELEVIAAIPAGICGVCGVDDRVSSSEDWVGRLMPTGCTASVWNEQSCLVSAGHCVGGTMVIEMNVPLSDPDCGLNHPPIADQFPITAVQFDNGGPGNDWSVMRTGDNGQGQSIYERYGQLRTISTSPPVSSQMINVWGYGVDTECTLSQSQQRSTGSVSVVSGLWFTHTADTTGGNSGSSVIRANQIVGIATHCPCPNTATRITHPAFTAARNDLCPLVTGACCLSDGSCTSVPSSSCASAGGEYVGDGFPCSPNPCPQPTGACCFGDGECVEAEVGICDFVGGTYHGDDTICAEVRCAAPACRGDVDGDGTVGIGDLVPVLAAWGPCPGCPEDVDGDGTVGLLDLLAVLAAWGTCP